MALPTYDADRYAQIGDIRTVGVYIFTKCELLPQRYRILMAKLRQRTPSRFIFQGVRRWRFKANQR